jgi:hypothetical protein
LDIWGGIALLHGSGKEIWRMVGKLREIFLKQILSERLSRFETNARAGKFDPGSAGKRLTRIEMGFKKGL